MRAGVCACYGPLTISMSQLHYDTWLAVLIKMAARPMPVLIGFRVRLWKHWQHIKERRPSVLNCRSTEQRLTNLSYRQLRDVNVALRGSLWSEIATSYYNKQQGMWQTAQGLQGFENIPSRQESMHPGQTQASSARRRLAGAARECCYKALCMLSHGLP